MTQIEQEKEQATKEENILRYLTLKSMMFYLNDIKEQKLVVLVSPCSSLTGFTFLLIFYLVIFFCNVLLFDNIFGCYYFMTDSKSYPI